MISSQFICEKRVDLNLPLHPQSTFMINAIAVFMIYQTDVQLYQCLSGIQLVFYSNLVCDFLCMTSCHNSIHLCMAPTLKFMSEIIQKSPCWVWAFFATRWQNNKHYLMFDIRMLLIQKTIDNMSIHVWPLFQCIRQVTTVKNIYLTQTKKK